MKHKRLKKDKHRTMTRRRRGAKKPRSPEEKLRMKKEKEAMLVRNKSIIQSNPKTL